MSELPEPIKLSWRKPKLCPKCDKKLHKAGGQGYNTKTDHRIYFILGRVCTVCEIIYLNPHFEKCKIIISDVGT